MEGVDKAEVRSREGDPRYAVAALKKIREGLEAMSWTYSDLYRQIHGIKPESTELQRFTNRFSASRSIPSVAFIAVCVANIPSLKGLAVDDLFKLE